MKSVSTKQLGIANTAKKYPHEAITVLHPHLDEHWLWEASQRVRKSGAVGVDGQSHADYEEDKAPRLKDLLRRAKDGSYRAPPVKRVYIPKDGGEKRGIGIPTYEDKLLQRAVVMLLEPIYEGEFHDFSFGFRPNKSPHQALEYLRDQCYEKDVAYMLDVDLRKYFDTIDHVHLREILHRRVGDGVITRLINKWLKAGVWEAGTVQYPDAGSPQGGVISPLLSNVYLHTILDDWYVNDIQPYLQGKSFMVLRKTSGKRFRRSLKAIKEWGWKHRQLSLKEQQEQINRKLSGHYGYYGITGNYRSLSRLRHEVQKHWRIWLGRRTRSGSMSWNSFKGLLINYPLIPPKIVQSYKNIPSETMI